MNFGSMELVLIQYWKVRVMMPEDDAWSMPVLNSSTFSGVRLIGMVGLTRSAIVPVGAYGAEEYDQRFHSVKEPSALAPEYQCDNL